MLSAGDVLGMQVQEYATGDVVRIINDIARVHDLQDGHGGWVDDIALVSRWHVFVCAHVCVFVYI